MIWRFPDIPEEEYPYFTRAVQVREGSERGKKQLDLYKCGFCPFCNGGFEALTDHKIWKTHEGQVKHGWYKRIHVCVNCGWWRGAHQKDTVTPAETIKDIYLGCGALKELDLSDIELPRQEVAQFLLAKYSARFELHPRLFEEVVADVFRASGYHAVVTGYSNDGGIDVILTKGEETIGVQVKRYKNTIDVEQIRSLAGALVINDMTKGIFITTSSFQSGAGPTASEYEKRGYKIELVDATRFYDALRLTRREMYGDLAEFEADINISKMFLYKHNMEHY